MSENLDRAHSIQAAWSLSQVKIEPSPTERPVEERG